MAVKMEQTKGYGIIVGKVYGIEGKEPRKNDYLSELRISSTFQTKISTTRNGGTRPKCS